MMIAAAKILLMGMSILLSVSGGHAITDGDENEGCIVILIALCCGLVAAFLRW